MKSYSKVLLMGEVSHLVADGREAIEFDMKVHQYKDKYDYIPCRAYGKLAELLAEQQGRVFIEGTMQDKVLVKELRRA